MQNSFVIVETKGVQSQEPPLVLCVNAHTKRPPPVQSISFIYDANDPIYVPIARGGKQINVMTF